MLIRKNFSAGLLASPLTSGSTTMAVGAGHTLPIVSGSFVVIIWDVSSYSSPAADPNIEIILASYSGTTNLYNITRAQEGTSASAHSTGAKVALTITAGVTIADMLVFGTKEIDESTIGDGKVPYYDAATGKIKYTALAGGSGLVDIAAGGTGQTTAQAAIDALTAVSGATNEYVLTKDTADGHAKFKLLAVPVLKQLIFGDISPTGGEQYANLTGKYQAATVVAKVKTYFPIAGTLKNLSAYSSGTQLITVYKNGSATALTVSTDSTNQITDSTHTVSVAANDYITMYLSNGNSINTWTIEFDPS